MNIVGNTMSDEFGEYESIATLFCPDCGNLQINTSVYNYCSRCEILIYHLKNYTVHKPPIMKAFGLAIAILRLECPEILLIHFNHHTSIENIFVENERCIPVHIRYMKGEYLRFQYLDAITDLIMPKETFNLRTNLTERQNVRTAVLTHIKNIFYFDIEDMKQADPLKQGDFKEIFNKCHVRVINAVDNFLEYSGNIYYCIECEAIGDRELLLPRGRSQLENCADCN